ncbi:MAG: nucleotidyltransferase family protein [Tateyamaria sp.]|nr:nucleotidyltransferase family protein [Tateyamaria sp.]MDG2057610.1 nucleotidyltransferase family protein [Tateyamaria sp.]
MISIILLAAGSSSRMRGRDKLCEIIDGVPLLRRQAQIALDISTHVLVALPSRAHPRYNLLSELNVEVIEVPDAAEGIGASLRTVFEAIPMSTTHAMLLLADMPDITATDLGLIIDEIQAHPEALVWRGMTENGKPGHPIAFHRQLFDALACLSGDNGGRDIVKAAKDRVRLVCLPGQRARCDLDTPEEWAAWRSRQI